MPLQPGEKLGHYEVLSLLGQGGMGEVYRAKDTKLDRQVAIKVLPSALARDAERLARFEREAKVLASLDHPNIGHIYGLADAQDSRALVLALIEGPTLADQMIFGPLPLDDSLCIAKQIIEALEYAHDRGVVHRDLKPANIKITPDGVVKVLDFGLAKVLEDEPPASSLANSPTMTLGHTRAGVILGTAAYMSPEQAVGRPVDRRSDIFSFGSVLYEMLTGKRAFTGATTPDVLEAVVRNDPDWSALPAGTPDYLRKLLERILAKDRKQRLQAIGEARIILENPAEEASAALAVSSGPTRMRWLWPSIATMVVIAAVVIAGYSLTRPTPTPLTTRFNLLPPPDAQFVNIFANVVISPDGRFLVYGAASGANGTALWLRPLDSLEARLLPGTEGANLPFWSPDGKSLAFVAGGKLKRADIAGGAPLVLCDASVGGSASVGGTWNSQGDILFGGAEGLYRIPASGGTPTLLTKASGDTAHGFPQFLPDGKRFLYFAENPDPNVQGVYASSLDRPQERKLVVRTGAKALYTTPSDGSPGHLLWMREQTLFAQRFDAGNLRLEGEPTQLASDIALGNRRAAFWTSASGVLAYRVTSGSAANLWWIGRDGKRQASVAPEGPYNGARLSPDAARLATRRGPPGSADIWLLELARNTWTRFTFDPKSDQSPAWSPDGRQIAFSSDRSGYLQIYRKDSAGAGQEEQLTNGPQGKYVNDWSRDGRYLLYMQDGVAGSFDLSALPLEGERKPIPVFSSPFVEADGRFSPNGKWIAYRSNESGRFEIYIQAFPGAPSAPKGKWQVSAQGGASPVWRGDGKELFFLAPGGKMMAAGVRETASGLEVDTPRELFSTTATPNPGTPYDVTADGQRFMMQEPAGGANNDPLTVIVNWQAGLKQ